MGNRKRRDLHPVLHEAVWRSTSHVFFVTISGFERWRVVMTTEGHIAALERRHQELEREIETELAHLRHDDLLIAALKRRKLEVKDELNKQQRSGVS
jgi:hypothetical protein